VNEMQTPATLALIAVTVAVSMRGFKHPEFTERYLLDPRAVLGGQWERLATSGFLHAGWAHLFFNMYTLWSFGSLLELAHGPIPILSIHLIGIVGGGLVSVALHRHHVYRALGASGGVSGVVFAAIFLFPGGSVQLMFVPIPIPAWLFAIAFVVGSYIALRRQAGNIGHDAHLGGALCGLAVATLIFPDLPLRQPLLYGAVVLITVGMIVHAMLFPLAGRRPLPRAGGGRPAGGLSGRDARRLDELLAKVADVGLAGLSDEERDELKRIADRRGG
jgi:membrane associated rhomboid family serine protease